jgi:hypothetical protein
MGEDLLLFALEKGGTKRPPNWDRGYEVIDLLPQDRLLDILERDGEDLEDFGSREEAATAIRTRLGNGLDQLKDAWEGEHRFGCLIYLARSRVLVLGGGSWGDEPFEGFNDVNTLWCVPEILRGAGFRVL